MTRRRRHPAAFTLLELVLVLALLAVVAMMVAPSFRNFARAQDAEDSANQILALSRWAQTQAVARAERYRLYMDQQTGQYQLMVERGQVFETLGEEFGRAFVLPHGVHMECSVLTEGNRSYVQFDPDGRVWAYPREFNIGLTQSGSVRLIAADGSAITLLCDSPTENLRIIKTG